MSVRYQLRHLQAERLGMRRRRVVQQLPGVWIPGDVLLQELLAVPQQPVGL